jgi:hypothetical protein
MLSCSQRSTKGSSNNLAVWLGPQRIAMATAMAMAPLWSLADRVPMNGEECSVIILSLAAESAVGWHSDCHHNPQHQEWGSYWPPSTRLGSSYILQIDLSHMGFWKGPRFAPTFALFCTWPWGPQVSFVDNAPTATMAVMKVLAWW